MGWQPMYLAPRDGTIIQIRNDWGSGCHIDYVKWTDRMFIQHLTLDQEGSITSADIVEIQCPTHWVSCGRLGHGYGVDAEHRLSWREAAHATPG